MQYTIHRALTMLKTISARIYHELDRDSPAWVRVSLRQDEHISGVPIKEITKDIQSHYDRVTALILNYIKIKSAIVISNTGVTSDTNLKEFPSRENRLPSLKLSNCLTGFTAEGQSAALNPSCLQK